MSKNHAGAGRYREALQKDEDVQQVCAYTHWGPCGTGFMGELTADHVISLRRWKHQKADEAWKVWACRKHNNEKHLREVAAEKEQGMATASRPPKAPPGANAAIKKTGGATVVKQDEGWSRGRILAGVAAVLVGLAYYFHVLDWAARNAAAFQALAALAGLAVIAWTFTRGYRRRVAQGRVESLLRQREGIARALPGAVPDAVVIEPRGRGAWRRGVLVRARVTIPPAVQMNDPKFLPRLREYLEHAVGQPLILDESHWKKTVDYRPLKKGERPQVAAAVPAPSEPSEADVHEDVRENLAESLREQFRDKTITVTVVRTAANHSPTEIRIFYGRKFPDAKDTARQEFLASVAAKTDERWRPTWDKPRNVVLLARRPEMPPMVPNRIPDLWQTGKPYQFPLGVGERTDLLYWDIYDAPHALIAGGTGSGKTILLQALIWWASIMGWDIVLVDPKGTGLGGLRDLPGVAEAALADPETMNRVLTENALDMRARYNAVLYDGVPFTHFSRRLLVVDEYAELVSLLKAWWAGEMNQKGEPTGIEALRSVPRLGREANSLQVTGVHQANGRIFQGTEVRELYGLRIGMGPQGEESAKMLFDRVDAGRDIPQTAKGRATYALKQGEPEEMQTFWTPTLMPDASVKPRRNEDKKPHPDDVALIARLWETAREAAARREKARTQAAVEAMDRHTRESGQEARERVTEPVERPVATIEQRPPRQRAPRPETATLAYLNTCAIAGQPRWVIDDGEAVQVVKVGTELDDDDNVEVTFRDAKRNERSVWLPSDTVFVEADNGNASG